MAYARRKYGQRKMYRRRRYVPKNTKVVARKAFNMVRAMRRTYKPELKKYDNGQSSYACGTTAGFVPVTGIAQGDNYNNREGNKILVRYVNAKGWIKHNNTATDGQVVKVWLIQDKQQVGDTAPTAAQLFTVAANSVTSPLNPTTCGRFKILWSKTYIVDPSNEIKPFYLNKKCTYLLGIMVLLLMIYKRMVYT